MLKVWGKTTSKIKYVRFKTINDCINNRETEMAARKEVLIVVTVFN